MFATEKYFQGVSAKTMTSDQCHPENCRIGPKNLTKCDFDRVLIELAEKFRSTASTPR